MVSYLNLSHHLDERRQEAKAAGGQGPRVVVLGPMDSGKSTLVRMLANWAARKGWQPMVVDVDVGGWVGGWVGWHQAVVAVQLCPLKLQYGSNTSTEIGADTQRA